MSRALRVVRCPPSAVFAVLADGWAYGLWVVGAARIRAVDDNWPAEGSRIHHSVGLWPALLHGSTRSTAVDPPHRLQLAASAWPVGEAVVDLRIDPHDQGCVVTFTERATSVPAALVPAVVQSPLLTWRNSESLRRLAFIAEGRARS